ncbi:hypothetical protein FH972_024480 [Carpinus fangiana]|uniref:Uncharacterized protein n=1 Tax=Carpinus fangiana TaxID=176857 RepID=A0A5N6KY53_9ROSI|nr:hypothetical protein FH972_024480 [Carpinus fangiana]
MATPDLATITERMKVVTDALHDRRSRMEFRDLPEDDDNPKDENERPRNLLLTSRRAPRVVKPLRSTVGASMSLCGGRGLPSERGSFLKNPKTGFTKMKIKVEHVGSVDDDFVLGDLLREYDYRLREVEGMMFGAGKKVDLTFLDEVVGRIEEALEMHLGQDSDCLRGSAKHNAESVHSAAEDDRNDGGHAMAQGGSIEDHDML